MDNKPDLAGRKDKMMEIENVAWYVPELLDTRNVERASIPKEMLDKFHGDVAWGVSLISDETEVTDKHGVTHRAEPLILRSDHEKVVKELEAALNEHTEDRIISGGEEYKCSREVAELYEKLFVANIEYSGAIAELIGRAVLAEQRLAQANAEISRMRRCLMVKIRSMNEAAGG